MSENLARKRCVVVMYDTLCRHFLPNYGNEWVIAPNFERLAKRSIQFENFFVGSMPCMAARREMHTGRYNFLHRSWGPLEPFDDSMPSILHDNGVHSHKVTDHLHYWEDGGATYHQRYTTFDLVRGQEGDKWKGDVEKLRDPKKGCAWDKKQTLNTIIPYSIEEVYEVAEQVYTKNYIKLKEELGDLLFQVIYMSQIASEKNKFNFYDVVDEITNKMIKRHPHVFKNKKFKNIKEFKNWWEKSKNKKNKSLLDDIPNTFLGLFNTFL